MTDIKVIVDGHEYSESQFKKDLVRMFDGCRNEYSEYMGTSRCTDVKCENCPLPSCLEMYDQMKSKCFQGIKDVYEWAQENPIVTNKDKLKETFGEDVFNHICAIVFEHDWFDQEYKDPKGDQKK